MHATGFDGMQCALPTVIVLCSFLRQPLSSAVLSDMEPPFELDEKPRDPSLTIADTLGSSPELGISTLTNAATPSAQVIQPVVSLERSPLHRYWLPHHRSIRLLMISKFLLQRPLWR
jgi:hypothetical protein